MAFELGSGAGPVVAAGVVAVAAVDGGAVAVAPLPPFAAASTSALVIRPPRALPWTPARLTPSASAMRRATGDAFPGVSAAGAPVVAGAPVLADPAAPAVAAAAPAAGPSPAGLGFGAAA